VRAGSRERRRTTASAEAGVSVRSQLRFAGGSRRLDLGDRGIDVAAPDRLARCELAQHRDRAVIAELAERGDQPCAIEQPGVVAAQRCSSVSGGDQQARS